MLLRFFREVLKPGKGTASAPAPIGEPTAGGQDELIAHGKAFEIKGELEAALACYRACAVSGHNPARAHIEAANVLVDLWRMDEAIEAYSRALAVAPDSDRIFSGLLFFSHLASSPPDAPALYALHKEYGRRVSARWKEPMYDTAASRTRDGRRLRIGYVSPNFSRHSVGYFIEPVIALHDRGAFEVYCYYTDARTDETTERIAAYADAWRHVHAEDDDALARVIRADGIDILVDLSGHTAGNRLGVFARKPAEIQMTWLGYADTTGLPAIDFRITDGTADPEPRADALHTEQLLRLDDVFLCYKPSEEAPAVNERSGSDIVFGSFNALEKINEHAIAAWARILQAIPGSRLLIKAKPLQFGETAKRFRHALERHGIAPDKVELHTWSADRAQHLGLYGAVDVGLDTFPYNGTTTTCEALWMGVPVVTLTGETHMSRVGTTLLRAVGLDELVATSAEAYIETAVALARDHARRAALRASMRQRLQNSVLLDHHRFVRNLERALRCGWQQSRAGSRSADDRQV